MPQQVSEQYGKNGERETARSRWQEETSPSLLSFSWCSLFSRRLAKRVVKS